MGSPHPTPPCDLHGQRLDALDARADDHSDRLRDAEKALGDGRVEFANLHKDVSALTEKVSELTDAIKSAVRWVLGTVGTIAVGALLWALVQSQAAPKASPAVPAQEAR